MNITNLYDYAESSLAVNVPKAKALKAKMICPVHRRKVLFTYDFPKFSIRCFPPSEGMIGIVVLVIVVHSVGSSINFTSQWSTRCISRPSVVQIQ